MLAAQILQLGGLCVVVEPDLGLVSQFLLDLVVAPRSDFGSKYKQKAEALECFVYASETCGNFLESITAKVGGKEEKDKLWEQTRKRVRFGTKMQKVRNFILLGKDSRCIMSFF